MPWIGRIWLYMHSMNAFLPIYVSSSLHMNHFISNIQQCLSLALYHTPSPPLSIRIVSHDPLASSSSSSSSNHHHCRLIIESTQRINDKNSRVARLKTSSSAKGDNQSKSLLEAVKAHNYYRTMWLNRKQLCMDAIDLLSEGTGKKMKDIMVWC